MVDAVPASLIYARDYLRAACPDARIGFYYDSDAADIDSFDCYIAPAWHFEGLNGSERYDVCVNIESFQEMTQAAVDAYIGLFDRIGADDAIFSISNADDYQFRGSWNSPPTWRRLFPSNTLGRGRTITRRRYSYPRPVTIARSTRQSKPPTAAACRGGFRHATACRPRWSRNSTPTALPYAGFEGRYR